MTWRARADVARVQADVARGPARVRCGTEATWKGRVWPTRGASGTDTWQEATWVHADAREGRHVAERGLAVRGPW